MRAVISTAFFLLGLNLFGQEQGIDGIVVDAANNPLVAVPVTILDDVDGAIITYQITNTKGEFSLSNEAITENAFLKVKAMGFSPFQVAVAEINAPLTIILQATDIEIPEILVEHKIPIIRKGDTLNYAVDAFTDNKDRVLADVLEKMPGIDVLEDGQVLYQGKAINKYYIENLDLLEGRYNLANKNIPVEDVVTVQVLEEHQPIKMLEDVAYSGRAALNIKLKKNTSITGAGKTGTGGGPFAWDANVTPMLFAKKKQFIGSYQSNNIGIDASTIDKVLTIEDFLSGRVNFIDNGITNIREPKIPTINERRWLDNQDHYASLHSLFALNNNVELKVSGAFHSAHIKQNGSLTSLYDFPFGTINIAEELNNNKRNHQLRGTIDLEKNTKSNFLKNKLEITRSWNNLDGLLNRNGAEITQEVDNKEWEVYNGFRRLFPIKNKIVTLNSVARYTNNPNSLQIEPGVFNAVLNNGVSYEGVQQDALQNRFYNKNSASTIFTTKQFSFEPHVEYNIERTNLHSSLFTKSLGEISRLEENRFKNRLTYRTAAASTGLKTEWTKNAWRVVSRMPLRHRHARVNYTNLDSAGNAGKFVFEPSLAVHYQVSPTTKLGINGSYINNYTLGNQLLRGYMFRDYRNFQRKNGPISSSQANNYGTYVKFDDAISGIFLNGNFNYTLRTNEIITSTMYEGDGSILISSIMNDNNDEQMTFSAGVGKLFSRLNTSITLTGFSSSLNSNLVLNGEFTDYKSSSKILKLKWNNNSLDRWILEGNSSIKRFVTEIDRKNVSTFQNHAVNVSFFPKENQYLTFSGEFQTTNELTTRNLKPFLDTKYTIKLPKKGLELAVQWNNMLNNKNYQELYLNENYSTESNLNIRNSYAMLHCYFSMAHILKKQKE